VWWGSRGQAGASGLDPRPVISRVRALVGLGGSKVGVGRRGGGIKERRVPVAGGWRRALAWRRGKKHRGRRQAGVAADAVGCSYTGRSLALPLT
jgi:hypothetical protein